MNNQSKKILLISIALAVILVFGLFLVIEFDEKKAEEEALRLSLYESESRELIVQKQNLMLEYANVERYTLNKIADASYIGIVFTEIDSQLFNYAYPLFCNREIPVVGMMCLSKESMPGDEGLISRSEFDILKTAGWNHAIYWNGEGTLRAYIAEMKEILKNANIDIPETIVFAQDKYALEYDKLIASEGFLHVIHHGESGLNIIDKSVEGNVWHPGMISWNTKGISNELLSTLISYGGVAMFEVNFSGGNEILFDHTNSYRVAAFNRMLNVIENCATKDELVITSIKNAKLRREFYLQVKEDSLEDIAARRAEILVEIDRIDAEITAIYNKYHS